MPITKENQALYPKNWKSEIVPRILERDGYKCVDCGLPRYSVGIRQTDGRFLFSEKAGTYSEGRKLVAELKAVWGIEAMVVVLEVAHLNQDPRDCRDSNLASKCSYHHHAYDRYQHATNAKATRQRKQYGAGSIVDDGKEALF
jgi:hypothetical protein